MFYNFYNTVATTAAIKYLLIAVGVAGFLLLLGFFLRSKVKLFQKLFLPASVIGGFIGLILGGQVLGKIWPGYWEFMNLSFLNTEKVTFTVMDDINSIFTNLPGVLIIPIFAATCLGNFSKKKTPEEKAAARKKGGWEILPGLFFLLMAMMVIQMLIGYVVNIVATAMGTEIYAQFGFELAVGFVGGHGTAASIPTLYGAVYKAIYADGAANITSMSTAFGVTFATIGLVGGMIGGIAFINVASRKGQTAIMKEPVKLEGVQLTGIQTDPAQQESAGRQTVKNFAIESITVHVAIIAFDCLLAYLSVKLLSYVPGKVGTVLSQIPVWSLAMLYMFGINAALKALKLEWLIDRKLVSRITGSLTDIAIVCAVASMNLTAILTYWYLVVIIAVIGFVVTYFYIFKLTKALCGKEAPFEHAIIAWGACTGVMMTGLMLLKICDPNYETKALPNFTKSFAVMSVTQTVLFLVYAFLMAKGTVALAIVTAIFAVVFTAAAVVFIVIAKKHQKAAPEEAPVEAVAE